MNPTTTGELTYIASPSTSSGGQFIRRMLRREVSVCLEEN